MGPAIRVENLSKQYKIATRMDGAYRTLRETIEDIAAAPLHRLTRRARGRGEDGRTGSANSSNRDFWALKDVSFEVEPGEVVGIIGRNGAGKSTLLKILSRITEPTSGRAEFRGRLGSLLEVGTGFHPELTGRENVYLNGSILGMSRQEIDRQFDEIVRFSEIGEFLDTPVKRYSSGMYVRLAFAVAVHLEPEILVIDEVLAVGDATYQKRCIDRMYKIARSGRSVLFVSHNMDLIPRLCEKVVWLERGRIAAVGAADGVVKAYLQSMTEDSDDADLSSRWRTGDGRARFTHVWLIGANGQPRGIHPSGEDLGVRIRVHSQARISNAALAVNVMTLGGTRIHSGWTREVGYPVSLNQGVQEFQCDFQRVRLRPGQQVKIGLWMEAGSVVDSVPDALTFDVVSGQESRSTSTNRHQGVVLCDYRWSAL
jgi:lipopolysaccharide transport system ATP-binding protein